MSRVLLAALAAAALGASANAGPYAGYRDRIGFGNYSNGTEVTGVSVAGAGASLVHAVALPSGEIISDPSLRHRASRRTP
jgi:hypothetical protein